jgi:hypothetical protein
MCMWLWGHCLKINSSARTTLSPHAADVKMSEFGAVLEASINRSEQEV